MQLQPLLNIEATLYRIEKLLAVKKTRERKPKVEMTDAEWLASMKTAYPQLIVEACLRDCEAHYVSRGQTMTRAKGAAWLKRQAEWNKPVSVPAQKKGLVL